MAPLRPSLAQRSSLLSAFLRIVERDEGEALQAPGSIAAIRRQPVVVHAEAGALQCGIFEPEQPESQGRVEHLRLHPVQFHIGQALGRVPPARAGVGVGASFEKGGQFLRRPARTQPDGQVVWRIPLVDEICALLSFGVERHPGRPVPILDVEALHPEVWWLTDVRVGGDQLRFCHGSPPAKVGCWGYCTPPSRGAQVETPSLVGHGGNLYTVVRAVSHV